MPESRTTDGTVLVTGVNNPEGIGAAIARAFGRRGDAVFLTGRPVSSAGDYTSLPAGEERYAALKGVPVGATEKELAEAGVRVAAMEADLSDPDLVPVLFDRAEERLGPVGVLVHSAAHCSPDGFAGEGGEETLVNAESHDRHFAVNSRAAALLMREFARRFREHGLEKGRIINVAPTPPEATPDRSRTGRASTRFRATPGPPPGSSGPMASR